MHHFQLLFSMPGGIEILLVVVVIILLFGAKKLPELGKGLGKSIKEFKDAKGAEEKNAEEPEEKK